jgi:hypothetical protein
MARLFGVRFWAVLLAVLLLGGLATCGGGGDDDDDHDGTLPGDDDTADDDSADDDATDDDDATPPPPIDDDDDSTAAPPFAAPFSSTGADFATAVGDDPDGNVYVAGYFSGAVDFDPSAETFSLTPSGGTDGFVAKFSPERDLLWAVALGGPGDDAVRSIAVDSGGNVAIGGTFAGTVDFDPGDGTTALTAHGQRDAFVARLGDDGALRWAWGFGGADENGACTLENDLCDDTLAVTVTADGAVLATGGFNGTATLDPEGSLGTLTSLGGTDAFVAAYSREGALNWAYTIGSLQTAQGRALDLDVTGNAVLGGVFSGEADLNPRGGVATATSAGERDVFVVHLGVTGPYLASFSFGGAGDDVLAPGGIAVGAGGDIHLTGWFEGTFDADPSGGVKELTSAGGTDAFLARFLADDSLSLAFSIGGAGDDGGRAITVDPDGQMFVSGWFRDSMNVSFDGPASFLDALSSGGAADAFLLSYTYTGAFGWSRNLGSPVTGAEKETVGAALRYGMDDTLLFAGRYFGDTNFGFGFVLQFPELGAGDGFVIRYTPTGEVD